MVLRDSDAIRAQEHGNARHKVKKMIRRWSSSNPAGRTSSTTMTLVANKANGATSPKSIPRLSTPILEAHPTMSEKALDEHIKSLQVGLSPCEVDKGIQSGTATSLLAEEKASAKESVPEMSPDRSTQIGSLQCTQPPNSASTPIQPPPSNPTTSSPQPQSTESHPSPETTNTTPRIRSHKSKPSIHIPPISPDTGHQHTSSTESDIEKAAMALVLPKSTITTTITAAATPVAPEPIGKRRNSVKRGWMDRWSRLWAHERAGRG
ncbi:uncharacterized protein EI97DRAFT_445752 [Westerdykella ornata]|uniref:Uncharacterized protein n=1 Tax=Westerdykella ornata TaxID=318751 RepID=A0A6A6J769_WESOR|nr:uncharacterized protein EI97DRAFT_445752 [Westerdykella ornata]KAF2272420.1 hypothetical protein EI97DRAFT_445752 [Westerdykella ornata]